MLLRTSIVTFNSRKTHVHQTFKNFYVKFITTTRIPRNCSRELTSHFFCSLLSFAFLARWSNSWLLDEGSGQRPSGWLYFSTNYVLCRYALHKTNVQYKWHRCLGKTRLPKFSESFHCLFRLLREE